MAISSYEKDGKILWQVYLNLRSKTNPSIRKQRRVGELPSEKAASAEEKRILRDLAQELSQAEGIGLSWQEVVNRWEVAMREGKGSYAYVPTTITDYVARIENYTPGWLKRPACELNKADGREVLRFVETEGKTRKFQKMVKETINVVFDWGIEQRLIRGVQDSPMRGLELTGPKDEKVPDILTLEEIRILLREARMMEHRWYPIWAMALLTGMRGGELHALEWTDVDFENRKLMVSKSYHTRLKRVKSTKSGAWRTVPMSDELMVLLHELKANAGDQRHVLPRSGNGNRASRPRCSGHSLGIGIRSIRFHALRACFATQLLANDIAPARVMKICGWEQMETMQRYIRMAGIDERGATQVLRFLPSDHAVMGEVVSLFEFKAKK